MTTKAPAFDSSVPSRGFVTPKIQAIGVLILFAVVYVGSLFSPGMQDDADSTHAEAAREMSITHDYVTLKINGNRYLEKAPLMYWAVSLCYSLFGVNEFAAHLPVAISMLLLVLLAMRRVKPDVPIAVSHPPQSKRLPSLPIFARQAPRS